MPWHDGAEKLKGKQRLEYVIKVKQSLDICEYGDHIPESIKLVYDHIRNLKYTEEPNYNYIKACIQEELSNNGIKMDGEFEWNLRSPGLGDSCEQAFKSCFSVEQCQ